jgi:hypothetical protein
MLNTELQAIRGETHLPNPSTIRVVVLEVALIAMALFTAYSIGVVQARKEGIAQILTESRAQLQAAREAHARAALREAEAEALRKRMSAPSRPTTPGEINVAEVSSL